MSEITPLDLAHAAMDAAPEDDTARLRFYERLADSELFLLLGAEAAGQSATPELFPVEDVNFVLLFDREERLAAFTGRISPYVALSGRAIAEQLAGQGVGFAVNLDTPSAILIPPEAVSWLAETIGHAPEEVEAQIEAFHPPHGLPETLITALDTKLALAAGLADCAFLAGTEDDKGRRSHMLAFIDAVPGAEGSLAKAASEALTFSGIEAGQMDVGFFRAADVHAGALARVGLRFDLPEAPKPQEVTRIAPGSDPEKPPILR
ncbi:SseB family protein [Pseudooceanicola sp. CBS1P-1]|uniref:SseB family protein n=1 Tax=Pseudooceanicola albus TaxID=2692189 RepID=A0A6L7G186_9RHOB|nr:MULTISPECIES: SseB family protein [Pseudooceanicola]MBT9384901.1 SseB family protein [Pseudooceanicola endophyticus]MXN18104.1 SseB family protein [Pseudooceanicola albus]